RGSFPEVSRVTRKFRVPCIVEYNGVLVDELKITKTPLWRRMLSQRREAIVANSCSAAIAVDESTREGMIRHYPVLRDKCATVLNGCDVDLFDAVRDVPKDPKRLIFVGSLFSWARLDIGLRAMALLPEDVTLDVIGDGERLSEYRKLSADLGLPNRVRFHGRLPHKDIPKWLSGAAAGLAIESAGFEGSMPLKVSEYLAAGCVLVANGYPCHRHLEALGHARLFPTPPTPEGVATAVIEALTPAALDDSAVRARRSYAREHLSWERAAREILAVIDKVAESGAL
ncbi:MAG: glycosyltransferase family 4 protein, partial [Planctomycetaceae bacterium]|nr:glycosyltransferase family 4 protein [Planctomycetaceae bacterium]